MSIINQMLQKLEQRRGGRDASMPDGVRAVVRGNMGRSRRPIMLGLLAAAVLMGGFYSGWLWWQQHEKPAKSVAIAGKIPGAEVQPKVSAPPPVPEIVEKQVSTTITPPEETFRPPRRLEQKAVLKKKKDVSAEQSERQAKEGNPDEIVLPISGEPHSSGTKKPSRESIGRIRIGREGQEQSMKSVTPQQLSLSHYQKALSWLQQGRVAEARSSLEDAIKLDPYNLAARQALAGLLVEQRQFNQAEQVLQEGLNLGPEQHGFVMALARLQVERGDNRMALDTLYKGLPYAADKADYQAFLGALLQRSEQHKKAIEHYQAALQLAPSGAWQMGLGISMQAEHRFPEAFEAFGRAKASNELSADLLTFVEQRLRMIKKIQQPQVLGDAK